MDALPVRKRNRLTDFDYSQNGAYFITVCSLQTRKVFSHVGELPEAPVTLTPIGVIINDEISKLDSLYPGISVSSYVIMPDHIHMLIEISGAYASGPTISRIVQQFKGAVTKRVQTAVWQKGFHDHVIRDDKDYLSRMQYIEENPKKWAQGKDDYYAL